MNKIIIILDLNGAMGTRGWFMRRDAYNLFTNSCLTNVFQRTLIAFGFGVDAFFAIELKRLSKN